MKKIRHLVLLFTGLLMVQTGWSQQSFSDGEVNYDIQVDLPAGTSPEAASMFEGSQMTYLFKNYHTRSDAHIGKTRYSTIRNARDHTAVTLIESGSQKYMVHMTTADLKKESAKYAGITFKDQSGTKKIAGYNCRETLGKRADGSTFTVYYTPDLVPENQEFSPQFAGLKGLPLQFEITTSSHVKMTMTATKVSIGPEPAARFDIPKNGYRLLSYEELQSMRASH